MDPGDVAAQLMPEIQDGLLVVASGYPITELSGTLETLSRCFQSMAICRLLETADTVKFRDNLARSAFARRFFLRKSSEANNTTDRRLAISRSEAFFDALAAGHGLLAREIAARSIVEWHQGWEYEDDFCYVRYLHHVVMEPASLGTPASGERLQQFTAAVASDEPPRLAVLRALDARDSQAFDAALRALLDERDAQLQERKERLLDPDLETFLHWPRTFVCVEGLALISIARAIRIDVADDLPLCPPLARLELSQVDAEDPFVGIEAELRRAGG